MQVTTHYYIKDSKNKFRELYKNFPEFEWCALMKKSSKFSSNILAKVTIMFMKMILPDFVRPCPVMPRKLEVSNATVPNLLLSMISSADYRVTSIMKYKNGDVFFNSSVILRFVWFKGKSSMNFIFLKLIINFFIFLKILGSNSLTNKLLIFVI